MRMQVAGLLSRYFHRSIIFLQSFLPFFNTVLSYARIFSLTQALIKFTAPGVLSIHTGVVNGGIPVMLIRITAELADHMLGHRVIKGIEIALKKKAPLG